MAAGHDQIGERSQTRGEEGLDPRLQSRLILVVDDDPDVRDFVRHALEPTRYRLMMARSGREALAALADDSPDVVLLDIRMPGMSGEDVLELLQNIRGAPPVVIMTAGERARDLALEKHNPLYLAKPFDSETLVATLETAMGLVEDPEPEFDA